MKKIVILSLLVTLVSCSKSYEREGKGKTNVKSSAVHSASKAKLSPYDGTVLETMDAAKYTYVKIKNAEGKELWAAGPLTKLKVGDGVSLGQTMIMKNFKSKSLDRIFPEIYFVQKISLKGGVIAGKAGEQNEHVKTSEVGKIDINKISKADYRIEELFLKKKSLKGKEIAVRGVVVKFSGPIMGKNWIHLQDGTGGEGSNDLTVTTMEKASVGDTILIKGKIVTDKDFGYGYFYPLIIEDAKVTL